MLDQRIGNPETLIPGGKTYANHLKSIAVLATAMLFACSNDYETIMESGSQSPTPVQQVFETTITYTVDGRKNSTLYSPLIEQFQHDSEYFELPSGFVSTFYDTLGHPESGIRASEGTWLKGQQIMIARNNVVAYNQKNDSLFTEKLTWLQDSGIIVTDAFVRIKKEDAVIYGHGMKAKEDFSEYTIRKVTGQLEIEEETHDSIP